MIDVELEILQECCGLRQPRPWGAMVGAVLESLAANGLASSSGMPTERGRVYAAMHDSTSGPCKCGLDHGVFGPAKPWP